LAEEHAPPEARRVGFTLDTPRPGELGVVEDLLVDRAFVADPVHAAEELGTLADVRPGGPHNVANALAAAALVRAYGVGPEAVAGPGHAAEDLGPWADAVPGGPHIVANALAAAALVRAYGVGPEAVAEGLRSFRPGAHRAVEDGEFDGVRYIDDSKATNPHAAIGSLLAHPSVVWIAGGQLKGASVDELVAAVAERLRGVVLLGADADVFAEALARHAPDVLVRRIGSG